VLLAVNEDFWMKDLPEEVRKDLWVYCQQNVRYIEYQIIQEASSRAIALEMGTIDVADSIQSADIEAFQSNPDITVVKLPVDPPVAMVFNCNEVSPTSDENLRKAICTAINNAEIAAGLSIPAYAVYGINPNMYDAPADWLTGREYYDYSLDKVKEYLAASNYGGEELVLMYNSIPAHDGSAIMIQSQLKAAGINVKLYSADMSVLITDQYDASKWDMRFQILGGGSYLSATIKYFASKDHMNDLNGLQVMLIEDTELDELFDALDKDNSEANIDAWDDYFTYDKCYGYGIVGYYDQTACRSDVIVALGSHNAICPNACTFA